MGSSTGPPPVLDPFGSTRNVPEMARGGAATRRHVSSDATITGWIERVSPRRSDADALLSSACATRAASLKRHSPRSNRSLHHHRQRCSGRRRRSRRQHRERPKLNRQPKGRPHRHPNQPTTGPRLSDSLTPSRRSPQSTRWNKQPTASHCRTESTSRSNTSRRCNEWSTRSQVAETDRMFDSELPHRDRGNWPGSREARPSSPRQPYLGHQCSLVVESSRPRRTRRAVTAGRVRRCPRSPTRAFPRGSGLLRPR